MIMAAGRTFVPRPVGRRPLASGKYLLDEHRRASTVRLQRLEAMPHALALLAQR